ncbi:unannotated protein [freshwater metagenome]|jgi:hypothetical protein|uniref:Unannotated protein n=1 Tax=freshwater metagenome TaxID=449393 RepID=A0A6J7EB29_9ZZZZ|nr:hypothetical protein [Actinomycetota bacterium]
MRKFLVLIGLGAVAAWIYKSVNDAKAYDSLWTDATSFTEEPTEEPDLR